MRHILLHCHFFKNAGSTIDWALHRSFLNNLFVNKDHFDSIFDWNDSLLELVEERDVAGVTTHIFSIVPPKKEGLCIWPVAMVRHPIERVSSVFRYDQKRKFNNAQGLIPHQEVTIQEYVKIYLQHGTPAFIRNMHTLRFANRNNGTPVTASDYQKAVSTLERTKTIGLVRRYDESMVLFEEHLRPHFPELDLAYIPQNINQPPATIEQRLQHLREELGDALYEQLCRANEYDLRLYVKTCELFEERIARIDHFESKLAEFRKRCQALAREQQP